MWRKVKYMIISYNQSQNKEMSWSQINTSNHTSVHINPKIPKEIEYAPEYIST